MTHRCDLQSFTPLCGCFLYALDDSRRAVSTAARPSSIDASGIAHHQCSQRAGKPPWAVSCPTPKTPRSTKTAPTIWPIRRMAQDYSCGREREIRRGDVDARPKADFPAITRAALTGAGRRPHCIPGTGPLPSILTGLRTCLTQNLKFVRTTQRPPTGLSYLCRRGRGTDDSVSSVEQGTALVAELTNERR